MQTTICENFLRDSDPAQKVAAAPELATSIQAPAHGADTTAGIKSSFNCEFPGPAASSAGSSRVSLLEERLSNYHYLNQKEIKADEPRLRTKLARSSQFPDPLSPRFEAASCARSVPDARGTALRARNCPWTEGDAGRITMCPEGPTRECLQVSQKFQIFSHLLIKLYDCI